MNMSEGRGIVRNTIYNIASSALPLVVAVFTIPLLIRGLGKERFGVLSLGWVLIGYFSLADFGLSRALTKFAAERIGQGKRDELPGLVWTSLFLMTVLGVAGGVLLALLSPVLVTSVLKIESTSTREILASFYLLSAGVPLTVMAAGLRGIPEAFMRFDLSGYVRITLGVFNFLGPAVVLAFTKSVVHVIAALIVGRALSLVAYLLICFRLLPEMKTRVFVDLSRIRPLAKFGGWITVSNVISPIMVNFDRFFLGAMVSVSALAYYSTPWEMVTRLLIIPTSFAAVMFPIFSRKGGAKEAPDPNLYRKSLKYVILALLPFCVISLSFAKEILQIWIGADFALQSFRVLQLMTAAVLLNGLAMMPFSLIQAAGRPDITAKFHILELVLYIPILWLLIREWGISGAAMAWLVRVGFDLILLVTYAGKRINAVAGTDLNNRDRLAGYSLAFLTVLLVPGIFVEDLATRAAMTALFLTAYVFIGWNLVLDDREKGILLSWIRIR